jgi:type I restriction enzyme S subunit
MISRRSTPTAGWRECTMSDLFRVKHGYAFDGKYFTDAGPYVLLTPGNFYDEGGFKLKVKEKYFTGEVPEEYILRRGDLLVAMTEQAEGLLGSSAIIPENDRFLHNQRLGLITDLRTDRIDKKFLYYLFNSRSVRTQIRASATGAKVRHTAPSRIGEVKVRIPSVATQVKIAGIFSAYDDLIANNTRRIAVLEEMAQSLYREWFVHFRFPGYEQARFIETKEGRVPEGWEPTQLADLIAYHIGGGWGDESSTEDVPVKAPVIRGTDIPDAKRLQLDEIPVRYHKRSAFSSRKLEPGDIVFEVSGGGKDVNVGRSLLVSKRLLTLLGDDVICASFCKLIRTDVGRLSAELMYWYLLECGTNGIVEQYQVQSTGIKNYKFSVFLENEQVALPPPSLQQLFSEHVKPLMSQVITSGCQNRNLRRTRDLLLPKLISGELDVEHLDIDTGDPVVEGTT